MSFWLLKKLEWAPGNTPSRVVERPKKKMGNLETKQKQWEAISSKPIIGKDQIARYPVIFCDVVFLRD